MRCLPPIAGGGRFASASGTVESRGIARSRVQESEHPRNSGSSGQWRAAGRAEGTAPASSHGSDPGGDSTLSPWPASFGDGPPSVTGTPPIESRIHPKPMSRAIGTCGDRRSFSPTAGTPQVKCDRPSGSPDGQATRRHPLASRRTRRITAPRRTAYTAHSSAVSRSACQRRRSRSRKISSEVWTGASGACSTPRARPISSTTS